MENLKSQSLTERIEELFLKIFKVVILVVMGLGLIMAIGLSLYSASLYFQTPKKPAPAKSAPADEVSIDKLLKQLTPEEAKKQEEKQVPSETPKSPTPQAMKYLEEVTALYRCSIEFAKAVGAQVDENDSAAASRQIEAYRSDLENLADTNERRGSPYIKDAVKFTCAALKNQQIIALRKDSKVSGVFLKILNFHLREWDRIQLDKAKFERAEEIRVAKEEAQEDARVMEAKILAITMIAAAGIAFAIFMIIALYLIFAKIETNLRRIANNGQELVPNTHAETSPITS
jgi:hypothetical protein